MTDADAKRQARMTRPWVLGLGIGLAVSLLAVAVIGQRRAIARSFIHHRLRALGVEEVSEVVESFDAGALRLRQLRIGSGDDLVVERIEARYSPSSLLRGRLESLSFQGVRLRGSSEGGGLSVGALDPLLRAEAGKRGESATGVVLPMASLAIEDAEVEIETPYGPLAVPFAATLRDSGAGELEGRVVSRGGHFRLSDHDLEARGIAIDADLDPQTGLPSGRLRIEALVDTREPPRLPELGLEGSFEAAPGSVGFDFTLANAGRQLLFSAEGRVDADGGGGQASVRMRPLRLAAGSAPPGDLLPLLRGWIEAASGSIEASGSVAWQGAKLRGGLDVAAHDLSISSRQGGFEGLNAAVHIDGPWPPSTPPNQRISIARSDFGLEFRDGLISFQLRPDGVLDAAWQWSFAGGTIRSAAEIELAADTHEFVIAVSDLDLAELLTLVDLEGLRGSGRIEGTIPIVLRGDRLEIRGGRLAATRPGGWIRYRGTSGLTAIASRKQGVDVVIAALDNFQYDALEARLDGDVSNVMDIGIHLSGANPDYRGGHPIEFNLNVESRLADLVQQATAVYRIPEKIEGRLRDGPANSP